MRPTQEAPPRMKSWVRLAPFLMCAPTVVIGANVGYQVFTTLNQLEVIEAQRDQWKRPYNVIQALNLKSTGDPPALPGWQ